MNHMYRHVRQDGYANLLNGLGVPGLDRTAGTFHTSHWRGGFSSLWRRRFSHYELTDYYLTVGLASKIIDRPADDCFARGVEIEEDEDDLMCDEYDRLAVYTRMADAIRWARLYGGSALLLVVQDGGDFIDPLNLDNIDIVQEIRVFDITCIQGTNKFYTNAADPNTYGKMEFYEIKPPEGSAFEVHETRLIPVGGEAMPPRIVSFNRLYWVGKSVLEYCMPDIDRYLQGLDWSLRLIERKQQAVYQMAGLGEMMANGDDGLVVKRINMVDQVRGNLNSVIVDKDDEYNVQSPSIDGVQAMLDEYQTALCASSKLPNTLLFGKSTRGLNQTGAGDLEAYYGEVGRIQRVQAMPAMEKLTSILWLQRALKSSVPDDWHIEFNPLWLPTAAEQAQTDFNEQQAQTQKVNNIVTLMTNQILAPEEARKVVVEEIYPEYEFSEDLPDLPDALTYSANVDTTQMDVPQDEPGSTTSRSTR